MAVAIDATGTADVNVGTTTSVTFSNITVGSGINRALVVLLVFNSAVTGLTVTWDSGGTNQSMGQIVTDSGNLAFLFGLVAPTSGNKTLSASWNETVNVVVDAISFTGVLQTGGASTFAHGNSATATSSSAAVSVTSATNNWIVAGFITTAGGINITGLGQTQIFLDNTSIPKAAASQTTGVSSVSMTASLGGTATWAAVGVDVVAAPSNPLTRPDWPNPNRGAVPSVSLRTHLDSYKLTLIGKDRFFGAAGETKTYDYPNPRGAVPATSLKTHTDSYKLTLIGKDRFFGAAGQGPTYDWPVPKGPLPTHLRTHLDSYKLTLIGQDQFFGAAGETKTYDYPNPGVPRPSVDLRTWIQQSRAIFVQQNPFLNFDFPNPRGPQSSIDLRTWFKAGTNLLFYSVPFLNFDWPNPRGSVPGISIRTHADSYKLTLVGQDQFFGAAGQAPTYDYPNPRGAVGLNRSWTGFGLTFPPFPNPFFNTDWPNPRATSGVIDNKTWLQGFAVNLQTVSPPPLNYDWPNPRGPQPTYLRYHADSYKLTLIGQDQFFGAAGETKTYDYPNPRSAVPASDLRTWLGQSSFVPLTVSTAAAPPPFNYDWPNPNRGAQPSISLKTHLDSYKLTLVGQDKFFGAAGQGPTYDWQNPRAAVPAADLRTWLQGFVLNQQTIQRQPFVYDWPNPRGSPSSIDLRTWIQGFGFRLVPPPSINFDWPVPRGAVPASNLRIWANGFWYQLLTPSPSINYDWPVPRGPLPTHLRTHADSYKLTLIGQDRFFGGPGQGPVYDYPNPRGPIHNYDLKTWLQGFGAGQSQFRPPPPNINYDWPVPKGPRPLSTLSFWTSQAPLFGEPFYSITVVASYASQTGFDDYDAMSDIAAFDALTEVDESTSDSEVGSVTSSTSTRHLQ